MFNQAQCLECGDYLVSKHRHDFVSCTCGNLFVDGGPEYKRRGVKNGWNSYREVLDDEHTPGVESLEEVGENTRRRYGLD